MGNGRRKSTRGSGDAERPPFRCCERGDCVEEGLYPAPKSPNDLRSYHWFCLGHVREYNRAWNFCAGMDEAAIEALIRATTVWERPTWPMGGFARAGYRFRPEEATDRFAFFSAKEGANGARFRYAPRARSKTPKEEALSVLDLSPPVTLAAIKARYKELVKRHHPDATGGNKESEDLLKLITAAYATLVVRRGA